MERMYPATTEAPGNGQTAHMGVRAENEATRAEPGVRIITTPPKTAPPKNGEVLSPVSVLSPLNSQPSTTVTTYSPRMSNGGSMSARFSPTSQRYSQMTRSAKATTAEVWISPYKNRLEGQMHDLYFRQLRQIEAKMATRGNDVSVPLPPRSSVRCGSSPLLTSRERRRLAPDTRALLGSIAKGAMGSYGGVNNAKNDLYCAPADKPGLEFQTRPPTLVLNRSPCKSTLVGPDPYNVQRTLYSKAGYSLGMPVKAASWEGLHTFSRDNRGKGVFGQFSARGLPPTYKRRDLNLLER